MTTALLIRRDTPIPRGTRLAYRVVLDYMIELGEDGWLDEGEDSITLADLEQRIHDENRWGTRYRPLLTCIVDAGVTGEAIGDEAWVPVEMDGAAPHHRPVRFETAGQADDRGRSYSRVGEYVTVGQPCCPECSSFKGGECDTCEEGVPAVAAAS